MLQLAFLKQHFSPDCNIHLPTGKQQNNPYMFKYSKDSQIKYYVLFGIIKEHYTSWNYIMKKQENNKKNIF